MNQLSEAQGRPKRNTRWWLLPLLLPYVALLFPQVYARATPSLLGFPFFYWYQFLWVILTSGILAAVYLKLKK
jgi:Protein of unknown function (DUF3311)